MATMLQLFNEFLVKVSGYPTAFQREVSFDQTCCALHSLAGFVEGDGGCAKWKFGSHKSIQAMKEEGVKYCHAEVGQRVLDRRLFEMVVDWGDRTKLLALQPTYAFRKKFMSGFPVGVHVYGAGYCYLGVVIDTARSRFARCVGSMPYLADVLRFVWLVGDRNVKGLCLEELASGAFHLTVGNPKGVGFLGFVRSAMHILEHDPSVRIGGDDDLKRFDEERVFLKKRLNGLLDFSEMPGHHRIDVYGGGHSFGFVSAHPVLVISGLQFDGRRRDLVKEWFGSHGFHVDGDLLDEICLLTTATSLIPVGMSFLKEHMKVMAILGDSVMKTVIASHCVSQGISAAGYTVCSERVTNASLKSVFVRSGLRDVCDVSMLSVDSKQNADILEAVVGFMSIHFPMQRIVGFLNDMEIVDRAGVVDRFTVSAFSSEFHAGLNSKQMETVMKLVNLDMI